MRKNPHSRILKNEPKKQHLNIVPKSCPILIIHFKKFLIKKLIKYKKTLVIFSYFHKKFIKWFT